MLLFQSQLLGVESQKAVMNVFYFKIHIVPGMLKLVDVQLYMILKHIQMGMVSLMQVGTYKMLCPGNI